MHNFVHDVPMFATIHKCGNVFTDLGKLTIHFLCICYSNVSMVTVVSNYRQDQGHKCKTIQMYSHKYKQGQGHTKEPIVQESKPYFKLRQLPMFPW